jgi:hypothetical protein
MIAFYATGTAVLRSRALFTRLNGVENLYFAGLPMTDEDIFRLQWRRFLTRVGWLLIPISTIYTMLAVMRGASLAPGLLTSLLAGSAQCLVVIGAGPLLLRVRSAVVTLTALALYAVFVLVAFFLPKAMHVLEESTIVFPAGWINRGYSLVLAGHMSGFVWFFLAGGIAILGFGMLRRVREAYVATVREHGLFKDDSERPLPRPEPSTDATPRFSGEEQPIREGFTPVSEPSPVLQEQLNAATDWATHGWLERLAGACLVHEEKILADFLTGGRLGQWTRNWMKALYLTVATVVLVTLVPSAPLIVSDIAAVLATCFAAPLLGGYWPAFATIQMPPQQTFAAAFYPVSYWRVSRVIFKINLARLAGWFILLVPICMAFSWRYGGTLAEGLLASLKILYLAALLQFIAVMGKHSKGTNDTRRWSPGMIAFLLYVVVAFPAAIMALFVAFIPEAPGGSITGGIVLAVLAVFTWWFYGLLYDRGRIDLLHEPDAAFR